MVGTGDLVITTILAGIGILVLEVITDGDIHTMVVAGATRITETAGATRTMVIIQEMFRAQVTPEQLPTTTEIQIL